MRKNTPNKIIICSLIYVLLGVSAQAQDFIRTVGGVLSVSEENQDGNANESSPMLIDNNVNTKFLLRDFANISPVWMQFQFNNAVEVEFYTITSGNDAPDRDPRSWAVQGSANGTTWTNLDARTGETFGSRKQTRTFDISSPASYQYYRLVVSENNGGTLFQVSEWGLFKFEGLLTPETPVVTSTASTEIYLTWDDLSSSSTRDETGVILERAVGVGDFSTIAVLPANTVHYQDNNLIRNTSYRYRLLNYRLSNGDSTVSEYGGVASGITRNNPGRYTDITDNAGELTASAIIAEQDLETQGLNNLIDNDVSTKMFLRYRADDDDEHWDYPLWFQYESADNFNRLITKYTITSGNDAEDRDPKAWTLQASEDGASWDILDSREDWVFPQRSYTETFLVTGATAKPYQFFRLHITENGGASHFQISEWEIWGIQTNAPEVPSALDVTDSTYYDITLAWQDNSTTETGFSLERSDDGVNFEVVATLPADVTSYVDEDLLSYHAYYYRIQAVSEAGTSMYSDMIATRTQANPSFPLAPINVTAAASGETSIILNWEDQSTIEDGFQIQRSINGIDFITLDSVSADIENYEDTGLFKATTYYYRIIAYNDLGQSEEPSNVASASTLGVNNSPSFDIIDDVVVCAVDTRFQITVKGLSAGEDEDYQELTFNLISDKPAMFDELTIEPTDNDSTFISFIALTDTLGEATVTLTVKDNGGTNNGGVDTFSQSFKMIPDQTIITTYSDTDNPVERGAVIELHAEGGVAYHWLDAPGLLSSPENQTAAVKPTQDYPYMVEAETPLGCIKPATIIVKMNGDYNLQANNILTPNNDNYNDVWVIWNINSYPDNQLKVYDASGRVVYQEESYANTWAGRSSDGEQLPSGVYYYIIDLGSGISPFSGSLTIIND